MVRASEVPVAQDSLVPTQQSIHCALHRGIDLEQLQSIQGTFAKHQGRAEIVIVHGFIALYLKWQMSQIYNPYKTGRMLSNIPSPQFENSNSSRAPM